MNRPKRNLRTTIMATFSLLLFITFAIMGVIFNIGVNENVKRNAEGITREASMMFEQQGRFPPNPTLKVFITDEDYQLPEGNTLTTEDAKEIAAYLQKEGFPLSGLNMAFIRRGENRYYATAMEFTAEPLELDEVMYIVYYVDVTGLTEFAGMVNILLLSLAGFIWLLASTVTTLLAGTITRPLRFLSNYAKQIGAGRFTPNNMYFSSVEFEELNQSLNQTAKQLAQYDNEQKTFFQNVSHELRTPLMSIKCYAEGIECGLMEPEDASRTILSETDRLADLVDDILYISRLDSLTDTQIKELADIGKIAADCVSQQQAVAEKNGVKLILETDGNPKQIICAPKHITRTLNNLISNALRYAKTAVTIYCASGGSSVEITVSDDGPGINPSDMAHIFERFYKGKNGLSGIGLSMVKSIVEQHGGNVEARNTEEGAAFTIKLPKQY